MCVMVRYGACSFWIELRLCLWDENSTGIVSFVPVTGLR